MFAAVSEQKLASKLQTADATFTEKNQLSQNVNSYVRIANCQNRWLNFTNHFLCVNYSELGANAPFTGNK